MSVSITRGGYRPRASPRTPHLPSPVGGTKADADRTRTGYRLHDTGCKKVLASGSEAQVWHLNVHYSRSLTDLAFFSPVLLSAGESGLGGGSLFFQNSSRAGANYRGTKNLPPGKFSEEKARQVCPDDTDELR
eukprot:gene14474-biopygen3599